MIPTQEEITSVAEMIATNIKRADGLETREEKFSYIAEVAIIAAEPHLRRKHRQELLDELIAEDEGHMYFQTDTFGPPDGSKEYHYAHQWLRAKKESE